MGFVSPNVPSSYSRNHIGQTLYTIVDRIRPRKLVEFGVLNGYSAISIGQALRDVGIGHLLAYDIWDAYPFRKGDRAEVQRNLDALGLADFVSLGDMNFFTWLRSPSEFDLLHLDISNDGAILGLAVAALVSQLQDSIMIFEGGSRERDEVDWMKRWHRDPINPLQSSLGFLVIDDKYPSLSAITHNRRLLKIASGIRELTVDGSLD